ncbi:hypothetical protein HMPREF1017_01434, partial [Bacteroides ovatus 3_8_47FAA]
CVKTQINAIIADYFNYIDILINDL